MKKALLGLLVAGLGLASYASAQVAARTGTLTGIVQDETSARLPGVTVTATSPAHIAPETAVTDEQGFFRIRALTPGNYTVVAELAGFSTVSQEMVRVDVGREYRLEFTLKVAAMAETITVVGESPIVDPKSSTVGANFQYEFLQSLPVPRGGSTPRDLLALHPAVDASFSVAGSPAGGTRWMFDGVDVSNPAHGNAWPFFNYDYIEETEVILYGAPAEYNATGAVFNVVTKSGGSTHQGTANFFFSNDDLNATNVDKVNEEFGTDLEATQILRRTDWNVNIGGPIVANKLHYYGSYQRVDEREQISGAAKPRENPYNRILAKGNYLASDAHRFTFSYEFDDYDLIDFEPFTGSPDPNAVSDQPSPTWTPYIHWQWTPDENSVLEAQFSGFYGYVDIFPKNDLPPVVDWGYYQTYQSYPGYYHIGRSRTEFRGDYTRFVEDWGGRHEFKLGAGYTLGEVEDIFRYNENQFGQNVQYYAYFGEIYGGRTRLGAFERIAQPKTWKFYVQDAWTIGERVTLNLGLRYDRHTAHWKTPNQDAFTWNDVSPRTFATIDLTGDGKTVLKGGWGIYNEGLYGNLFRNLDPSLPASPFFVFNSGAGGCGKTVPGFPNIGGGSQCFTGINAGNVDIISLNDPLSNRGIADGLQNETQNHFVIGFERELIADWSAGATYIRKTTSDIFGGVDTKARYVPATIPDPLTGASIAGFRRTTGAADSLQLLTNLDDFWFRRYNGVDLRLRKRFRNNWQFQVSYTLQKAEGNADNDTNAAQTTENVTRGSLRGTSPNHPINATGELTNSRRHLFKIQGSYLVKPGDVLVGWYYNYQSGQPYNRLIRPSSSVVGERVDIFAEERGSRRRESLNNFDLRLEKQFRFGGKYQLGILADFLNLFNNDTIIRLNETTGSSFEQPLAVTRGREIDVAIRITF